MRRDPRCVIHALPGPEDDEFCIRATACEVTCDPSARAMVHAVVVTSGIGGMIESVSRDPLFEFDLEQVDVARWLDIGQPVPVPFVSNGEPPNGLANAGNGSGPSRPGRAAPALRAGARASRVSVRTACHARCCAAGRQDPRCTLPHPAPSAGGVPVLAAVVVLHLKGHGEP